MDRRRVVTWLLLLGIVVPVVALVALSRLDVSSARYASYEVAMRAEALGPGKWLPGDIPSTAMDITETHDIDTNEVWFSYRDKAGNRPPHCRVVDAGSVVVPRRIRHGEVGALVDRLTDLVQSRQGAFHACRGEAFDYFLATDPASGLVLGWSHGDNGRKAQR